MPNKPAKLQVLSKTIRFDPCSCKRVVNPLQYGGPWAVLAKVKPYPSGVSYQPHRHVDDILDHRPNPASLHIAAYRRIVFAQTLLPHDAQQIVRKHACVQHEMIGFKFPGRQPFQIQIRLDFTMKLLAGAVIPV